MKSINKINIGDTVVMTSSCNNNSDAPWYNKNNTYKCNIPYIIKNIHYGKLYGDYGFSCTIETECGKAIRFTNGNNGKIIVKQDPIYEIY